MGIVPPPGGGESERSVLMVGLTLGTLGHLFFLRLVLVVASLCECSIDRTELCPGGMRK
jgi:hypothetical protein